MNKTLWLASLLSLSLTACGTVASTDPGDDDDMGSDMGSDDGSDGMDMPDDMTPPPPPSPAIVLEQPRAASTNAALSAIGHANVQGTVAFIRGEEKRHVTEQRFVTAASTATVVDLKFASDPTAIAARVLTTSAWQVSRTYTWTAPDGIKCVTNRGTILTDDPYCDLSPLTTDTQPATTPVTHGVWTLGIFDESANAMLDTCVPKNGGISCTLPAGAGKAYRIITSLSAVSELWDGGEIIAYTTTNPTSVARPEYRYKCSDSRALGNGDWNCQQSIQYLRNRTMTSASLTFDPIKVQINTVSVDSMTPVSSLTWNY